MNQTEVDRLRAYNQEMAKKREEERKAMERSGATTGNDVIVERQRRMEREMKRMSEREANPSPEPIIHRNQAHQRDEFALPKAVGGAQTRPPQQNRGAPPMNSHQTNQQPP